MSPACQSWINDNCEDCSYAAKMRDESQTHAQWNHTDWMSEGTGQQIREMSGMTGEMWKSWIVF